MIAHEIVPGGSCEACECAIEYGELCRGCAESLESDVRGGDKDAIKLAKRLGWLCTDCDGKGATWDRVPWALSPCDECEGRGIVEAA